MTRLLAGGHQGDGELRPPDVPLPEQLPLPFAGHMREIFCERRDTPLLRGARRGSVSFRLADAHDTDQRRFGEAAGTWMRNPSPKGDQER
jgi:hypothetical protein